MTVPSLILFAATYVVATGFAFAAETDRCSYVDEHELDEHEGRCVETVGGRLRLKQSHLRHVQFKGDVAAVSDHEHGWMYVNRKGDVLVEHVLNFDNGPDYICDGYVRYVEGKKCGYAAITGGSKTKAEFDACRQVHHGVAKVSKGCQLVKYGEHSLCEGGDWFCIDMKGRRVPCKSPGSGHEWCDDCPETCW